MKLIKATILTITLLLALISTQDVYAQFMPVVYDNTFGRDTKFTIASAEFLNGDVVAAGTSQSRNIITWVDRFGDSRFTKQFSNEELSSITKIISLSDTKILVLGTRQSSVKGNDRRPSGRAIVLNIKGEIERNIFVGVEGTEILNGELLKSGSMILSGSSINAAGTRSGYICKVSSKDKTLYSYTAATGEECQWFTVMGSRTELINAAFSSSAKGGSSVVRLDETGKPFFITTLPDLSFKIEKMISSEQGDIYVVGQGPQVGGVVFKIRPEGDIVFQKQIVPAGGSSTLNQLLLCPTGEVMVGGSDRQTAFFALLRSDGTELTSNTERGVVSGVVCNKVNGDCVVSVFDASTGMGKIIKLSKQGLRLYEKMTAASYPAMRINTDGDLLMASSASGRLSMLSNVGELLFDRYVVEGVPTKFSEAFLPMNGEVVFMGSENRVAKLAHGIYVSDVRVNKPVHGKTTAVFTVTLSGYSYSSEGAPVPVTVNYKTTPITASPNVNFEPVSGTVSFIPSTDGNERYLNKFNVEVPINSNDFLEGSRTFSLDFSNPSRSYLIKSKSIATIEDQPAIVKLIRTTAGMEGEKDVMYELGLFKTNGIELTNATKSEIVIDGTYGNGTADGYDFDMGRMPRLAIAQGKHSGQFAVSTIEDTRYETVKTVIINFNKIYAMSDTDVTFGSELLSCSGQLYDQAAYVAIESLGDHTKLNNVLSGFFKVSLLRAKDGATLTNNSGSDIALTTAVSESSTAKQGTNFVLSNSHDLRIWGDGRSGAVNLNGIVLYTPETTTMNVEVTLTGVKSDPNAGVLSISPDRNKAHFTIKNQ